MLSSKRVFIAEDDALLRADLRGMLVRIGCDVVGEAADGPTALTGIRRLAPDLAILDIRMPVMNGVTTAAHLQESVPSAVLLVTGWDYQGACRLACEVGAIGCLPKPFSEEHLARVLETWAQSGPEPREETGS
jgi:response regulator NasT